MTVRRTASATVELAHPRRSRSDCRATGAYYDRLGIRIRDQLEPQVFAPVSLA